MRLHPIAVDQREPHPDETVASLVRLGVQAHISLLPAGDFQWVVEQEDASAPGWVCLVERKTIMDLVASVDDGRLARFIDETGGTTPPPHLLRFLLVEGDVEGGAHHGRSWSPEQLEAVLVDAQLCGLTVLRSPSARTTPQRIVSLWRWSGKDSHTALLKPALPGISDDYLDPEEKAAVRILMCLPGWGESRARAAIRFFGAPAVVFERILARDYKAFAKVDNVGRGSVDKAAKFLEKAP